MEQIFLTATKNKSPETLQKSKQNFSNSKDSTAPTAPGTIQKENSPMISIVKINAMQGKTNDEAAQREERIQKCIESAVFLIFNQKIQIGDDLNLSKTLRKLEKREKELDKKLEMMDDLKKKLNKKPCFLDKEEIREIAKEQKVFEFLARKRLEKQYDPIFTNRIFIKKNGIEKELIKALPENLISKKYKDLLISYKESLRRKIIETEVEAKKQKEFSMPQVFFEWHQENR